MNLEQLIEQFELITDTEEGFDQIRKVILKQAVQGNLTEQDPNDEPTEELLGRIGEKKEKLYDQGEIRKPKDIPEVESPEYGLPLNWEWCRLGDLMTYQNGYAFKSSEFIDDGIGVVKIGDLQNGSVTEQTMNYISPTVKEDIGDKYDALPGDLMIAMSGATTGKLAFNNSDKTYLLNQRVGIIRSYFVSKQYLYHYLITKIEENLQKSSGSAIPNLSTKQIREIRLPLPPLEEQQRIVQKIETLFSQVDELEQKVQQDRQVDERLQVAVLEDLQSAETPEASRQSWQRLTKNFEQIYRKPEHIDQLKQAILNEAVQGRLVRQSADPKDEPAEKLLERIKEEREQFYEENRFRRPSGLSPVENSEIPYSLPDNWVWTRLGELIHVSSGQNLTKEDMTGGDVPVFGGNGISGYHDESNVDKPTVVIGRVGALCGNVHLTPTKVWVTDNAFVVYYPEDLIDQEFLIRWLRAMDLQKNVSSTAQPVISGKKIYSLLFPLPPLNEQPRIASKIERLNTWCDDLKEKLRRSRQTDRRLLEALVNGAGNS